MFTAIVSNIGKVRWWPLHDNWIRDNSGVSFTCERVARAFLADSVYTKTFKLPEPTLLAQHNTHLGVMTRAMGEQSARESLSHSRKLRSRCARIYAIDNAIISHLCLWLLNVKCPIDKVMSLMIPREHNVLASYKSTCTM